MPTNTGKSSEKEFEARLSSLGKRAYFYRVKDAAAIRGLTGKIGHADATPADYIVVVDGDTHFAEVKSTINETSFPFSMLKKGQNSHGMRILAARGKYNVYIHHLPTEKWFRVPLSVINAVRDIGKASLKWNDLERYRWV